MFLTPTNRSFSTNTLVLPLRWSVGCGRCSLGMHQHCIIAEQSGGVGVCMKVPLNDGCSVKQTQLPIDEERSWNDSLQYQIFMWVILASSGLVAAAVRWSRAVQNESLWRYWSQRFTDLISVNILHSLLCIECMKWRFIWNLNQETVTTEKLNNHHSLTL